MTTKQQLYYLIEHYMLGDYDTQTYSDEFSTIYSRADYDEMEDCTEEEKKLFAEIENIAKRVSCYKDDLHRNPGIYFTECDIRKKTIEVCHKLNIKY